MIALLLLLMQDAVPIEKSWTGSDSRVTKPGVELIPSLTRWDEFWERHNGKKEEVPAVDFEKHLVVACFPEGKFTGVAKVSAETDGKFVTLTILLAEKEASAESFKSQHAIVVLPRTARPIKVRTRVAECGALNEKRDQVIAELATACAKPGACHAKCLKDDEACLDCRKGSRSCCDALCGGCAVKRGVCRKCGLAPAPCPKPGGCHEVCNMSAKSCGECAETVNGCDALCEKCAGKTRCRLCGRPAGK